MLDLLIAGGLIVDGTGSPGFYGAVGIDGDTTRIIRGDTSLVETARAIDATGKVVCPASWTYTPTRGWSYWLNPATSPRCARESPRSS